MKNYKMIPKITLWVLMAFGIIFSIMFYWPCPAEGSLEVAGDFLDIPKYTDLMLTWNYILIGLVCFVTLFFVIAKFVNQLKENKKKALTSLAVVVVFVLLVIVCWAMGSPEEIKIIGYEGTENVGAMAQMTDACMYLTYILTLATIATMVWGIIYTKTLK